PAPERGAVTARHPGTEGLPRLVRPAGAAALRRRREGRPARGARAGVLAPDLRHRARRDADRAQAGHPPRRGPERPASGPPSPPGPPHAPPQALDTPGEAR